MDRPVPDELISAYFDGEVTPEERAEVERLLESSSEFRQQLDDTSKLSALLHSFPREAAPADLAGNVRGQVEKSVLIPSSSVPASRRSFRREWTAFGGGILATVAPLILFVVLNSRSADPLSMNEAPHKWYDKSAAVGMPEHERLNEGVDGLAAAVTFDAPQPMLKAKALDPRELNRATGDATPVINKTESLADKDDRSRSKDAAAGPAPAPAMMARSVEAGLETADTGSNLLQSQINNEFLLSLSNGDVIVPKVADPDSTVAVVELTVVDIERHMNEFKVLLQKRAVKQLDDQADLALAKRNESKEKSDVNHDASKKQSQVDDIQLIFVRAPGDQLADTIDEFSRNHPDLNWSPQLPIELPGNSTAKDADTLMVQKRDTAQTQLTDQQGAVKDPDITNEEAELAFEALIARNNSMTQPDASAAAAKQEKSGNQQPDSISARSMNVRRMNQSLAITAPATAQADLKSSNTDNDAAGPTQQNGLSYFRVAAQNGVQPAASKGAPGQAQNSPVPLMANATQYGNSFGSSMNHRYAWALANNDGRNSRPVKMLIVLKSQQSAAANHAH